MNRKILLPLFYALLIAGFIACENSAGSTDSAGVTEEVEIVAHGTNHDDEADYSWESADEIPMVLNGTSIIVNGNGATAEGSTVTITSAGTYNLSGTLDHGQIIVNTEDKEIVRLILNGVNINCSTNAPIYILSAEKAMIVLPDSSENYIQDGSSYVYENSGDNEPNAAVYSKSDLTIFGNGTLTVNGNFKDAITSKDGLIITSGTIKVNSVDDGIRGKDYLIVKEGNITINAGDIGLKSDNEDDASLGYISIESGHINITSGGGAIGAEKDVAINSGEITISSVGKGINGTTAVTVNGGTHTITSVDNGIHSNGQVIINNGTIVIASNDDAIHADYNLIINDGDINITKSYEGIESTAGNITINGGDIHLVSSDDGLNIAAAGEHYLYINGGYIVINASGDGIDANASIVMTAGEVIASGSSESSNSPLDYDGTFAMDGGFLVAAGSYSSLTKAPSTSSNQYCVLVNLSSSKSAGTIIHIETESGEGVLTYGPAKSYQSVAFSSSELVKGTTYNVYLEGSCSGTPTDGLYMDGTYTNGSLYKSFTISSTITTVN